MAIGVLDDDGERLAAMRAALASLRVPAVFFEDAPAMIRWLAALSQGPVLLSLDHDLGPKRVQGGEEIDPGTGRDVVEWLVARPPWCPVIVHSSNVIAAQGMVFALEAAGWPVERVIPMVGVEWVGEGWIARVRALLGMGDAR